MKFKRGCAASARVRITCAMLALGCAGPGPMVRGTQIEYTPENEQIIEVLERYRQRLQSRDAAGVLALVSKNYFEDSGTPDAADDYGYDRLVEHLSRRLPRLRSIRYGMEYRNIKLRRLDEKQAHAEVEVYIDASFQLGSEREGGADRYKRVTEYNKIELEHDGKRWLITRGL